MEIIQRKHNRLLYSLVKMFSFDTETPTILNFDPIEPHQNNQTPKESIYFQQEPQIQPLAPDRPLKLSDQIFKSLNLTL